MQLPVSRECNENEVYRKCGSPCQEICGEQKEKDCDNCIEGCFCKLGYVMEEKAGACVKPENCLRKWKLQKYFKIKINQSACYPSHFHKCYINLKYVIDFLQSGHCLFICFLTMNRLNFVITSKS